MKNTTNIYVNEVKLKSLIIRVNNKKNNIGDSKHNKRINELVSTFLNLIQSLTTIRKSLLRKLV